MKKIDVGQALSIVANLGIILSIVFLAVELQQNNQALGVQARLEREDVRRRSLDRRIGNPALVRAITKAREGEVLTSEEVFLLDQANTATLIDWMFIYMQVQDGLLGEAAIPTATWREAFHGYLPLINESWFGFEHRYAPEFVRFMEDHIIGEGRQ